MALRVRAAICWSLAGDIDVEDMRDACSENGIDGSDLTAPGLTAVLTLYFQQYTKPLPPHDPNKYSADEVRAASRNCPNSAVQGQNLMPKAHESCLPVMSPSVAPAGAREYRDARTAVSE